MKFDKSKSSTGRSPEYDYAVKATQRYLNPVSGIAIPTPVYLTWHATKRKSSMDFAEDQGWGLVQEVGLKLLEKMVGREIPIPLDIKGLIEWGDFLIKGDTETDDAKRDENELFSTVSVFHKRTWSMYYPSADTPNRIHIDASDNPELPDNFYRNTDKYVDDYVGMQIVDAPCWMDALNLYQIMDLIAK
jgi:hypothetical protein